MKPRIFLPALLVLAAWASGDPVSDGRLKAKLLKLHNDERDKNGLTPLTWDAGLARHADRAAKDNCRRGGLHHDKAYLKRHELGENLFYQGASRGAPSKSVIAATGVAAWIDEIADYNYDSNRCAAGKACGHYTQVVWDETTRVGCAIQRTGCGTKGFLACNYQKKGNMCSWRPFGRSAAEECNCNGGNLCPGGVPAEKPKPTRPRPKPRPTTRPKPRPTTKPKPRPQPKPQPTAIGQGPNGEWNPFPGGLPGGFPDFPGMPDFPGFPDFPGMPEFPGMPDMSGDMPDGMIIEHHHLVFDGNDWKEEEPDHDASDHWDDW